LPISVNLFHAIIFSIYFWQNKMVVVYTRKCNLLKRNIMRLSEVLLHVRKTRYTTLAN